MNERLTELAKQAKVEHCISHRRLDEFAELIVKECIDTVLDSSVEYATRPQIAEELKEHFGVKV